jgi:hypothetical protein
VAGDAVTATSNSQLDALVTRQSDHATHIVNVGDTHDRTRPLINAAVEDGARLVVGRIVGGDDASLDPGQLCERRSSGLEH